MVRNSMREGGESVDIGPDFARRAAGRDSSPSYGIERRLTVNAVNQGTIRFLDPQIGRSASFAGYDNFKFLWTARP